MARTIENHGFTRGYTMTVDGRTWTITCEHKRATLTLTPATYFWSSTSSAAVATPRTGQ